MKARVKATGEIVSVKVVEIGCDYKGRQIFVYEDDKRRCFADNELDFDSPDNTLEDYWTRLEHTYAGMAMQGILSNPEYLNSLMHTKHDDYGAHEIVPDVAVRLSHALVEKLKEKEEK